MENSERPIRVTVIQPSLAKYRVPVFRELANRPGIELQVVYGVNPGIPNVAADGFRAIPLPRWHRKIAGKLVMFQGAEWKYCSRRHSDVVVLRWSPRSLTQFPALLRARAEGVATVLWGHGYSKQERGWWRGMRHWLAERASAILFYEPRTRDAYVQEGWDPDTLFVALNSLDHTEIDKARHWWQEHPHELASFQREHGIDAGPVVLFVSRLQPANRVDLLIEATAQLSREIPGVKTVIIGNGPAEKTRLQAIAHQERIDDSLVFIDGVYDEMKLAPWFLSAKVLCYPANVGLSLIHALWYALPVVTSDNLDSQNPEVVALQHGVNGLMYKDESRESLVEALRTTLADPERQASMSQAARRSVEDTFTISRMVDGMEAAIRYAHSTLPASMNRAASRSPERKTKAVHPSYMRSNPWRV
ncbi:MAG: glycosyltransferase family 4 protein [Pirellulales bacterium]